MNGEKAMFSSFTYRFVAFFIRIFFRICHPVIHVEGRENLPEGCAAICANHSHLTDPIWVLGFAKLKRLPRSMAKKELFENSFMKWLLRKVGAFPVDRDGADITAIKTAMQTLKQGNKLLIFPEGTRIRNGKTSEPHSGAVLIAHKMKAPIVPVYLSTQKGFFRPIRLVFGNPYIVDFNGEKPDAQMLEQETANMMKTIYSMGEKA